MKTIRTGRKQIWQLASTTSVLVGAIMACGQTSAEQTNSAPSVSSESTELVNWIEMGAGGSLQTGDKAQARQQTGLPSNAFGGVTGFHYEEAVDKKGLFSADGRGIFDNHDYDFRLSLSHPDYGYIKTGFRQYREYYDGTGGLATGYPYVTLKQNDLYIDRGSAFLETALTLPDKPVLKFRYQHDYRSGNKDSTIWGSENPTAVNNSGYQRRTLPATLGIDEKTDTIAIDLTHTIKSTDFGLGASYVWGSVNDTVNIMMLPVSTSPRTIFQNNQVESKTFSAHAFTDSRLNDKWQLTTGYDYTSLRSSIGGMRTDYPSPTLGGVNADTRFTKVLGGSDVGLYTMALSMMYSPNDNLNIIPTFRVEKEDINASSGYNSISTAGVTSAAQTLALSEESKLEVAQGLDIRYVGITNWVLYARGDFQENRARLDQDYGTPPPVVFNINQLWHQTIQKYSAGANWYPRPGLNFAMSYYHKIDQNHYDVLSSASPTTYPGFLRNQDFITDGTSFRTTWRPTSKVTLVSRYDFSYATVDTQGYLLLKIPGCNETKHMFGETVTWTPLNRLFAQAGLNYVLDTITTGAEALSAGILQPSRNDYWTVNSLLGYAFNDRTDGQLGYTYTRAANYYGTSPQFNGGVTPYFVPYGSGTEEHQVSAKVSHQLTKNIRTSLNYAFTNYRDQLFGGNTDFRSHSILATLQYRF